MTTTEIDKLPQPRAPETLAEAGVNADMVAQLLAKTIREKHERVHWGW